MANKIMVDGNEAAAKIAYKCSEVCAIYPITPSSPMAEWCDEWSAKNGTNLWGTVPNVVEMESEGGAAGAVHGALATGALTTTFTASQGLLLMIPNMYKIAGELMPTVFHVSARSLAYQALSIFGDHSDVLSCRQTGFAMLAAASVQEVIDMALVSHAATLESRIPFLHFFDGFRTSHEVQKIDDIDDATIRAMIDDKYVFEHRARALSPDKPTMRGTAQNPDVYFQGRETSNKYYDAHRESSRNTWINRRTNRRKYKIFDYEGAPDAEHIIVAMGSGVDTVHETVNELVKKGKKVGLIKVRLYRPFFIEAFCKSSSRYNQTITVLDRVKEARFYLNLFYLDVLTALGEAAESGLLPFKGYPKLSAVVMLSAQRKFTPAEVKASLKTRCPIPKNHFTVGNHRRHYKYPYHIRHLRSYSNQTAKNDVLGLGSDGTVGANKNPSSSSGTLPITTRRVTSFTTPKKPEHLQYHTSVSEKTRFRARISVQTPTS